MKIAILFLLLISSVSLVARPVSYSGGWTAMSYNDYARNSFLVHYSPTSKYSIGYKAAYWHEKEYWLNQSLCKSFYPNSLMSGKSQMTQLIPKAY